MKVRGQGIAWALVISTLALLFLDIPIAIAAETDATAALPSAWSWGLLASMLALALGGMASVLGMWIGRDRSRPVVYALAMTVLIGSAIGVGIVQSYLDAEGAVQKQADLTRMMNMVREIAVNSGDLELAALIEAEGGGVVDMPEPEPEPEPELDAEDAPTDNAPLENVEESP